MAICSHSLKFGKPCTKWIVISLQVVLQQGPITFENGIVCLIGTIEQWHSGAELVAKITPVCGHFSPKKLAQSYHKWHIYSCPHLVQCQQIEQFLRRK